MAVVEFLLFCFHCTVDAIKNFGLLVHAVASFNFNLLSSIFAFLSALFSTLSDVAGVMWNLFADFFVNVGDFLLELLFCIRAVLVLLLKFIVLLWHALIFVMSSLELAAIGLWTGFVWLIKSATQAVVSVASGCGTSWMYGKGLLGGAFNQTIEGFTMLGETVQNVFISGWTGFVNTAHLVSHSSIDFTFDRIHDVKSNAKYVLVDVFMNIQKEAYIGVVVCLTLYILIWNMPRILHYMHGRGLTLPFVGARRVGDIILRDSDDDFLDSESDASELNVDDDDEMSVHSEGSDNESETEVNDDRSENFSDSEGEIDIRLPAMRDGLSRRGIRDSSHTPSLTGELVANRSREELEREIEQEKDKRACVVCQDRPKKVLILPCRHMCLCLQCANQIARAAYINNRVCPLCRTRIKTVMDVYV